MKGVDEMEFKRYSNYRFALLFNAILVIILFALMLLLGARLDNEGKTILFIIIGEPIFFLFLFELFGKFGVFYDTVHCDQNGVIIKTRKKTIKLAWTDIEYILTIRSRGAIVGWALIAKSGEKYELFPPRRKKLIDYVKSIQPDVRIE